MTYQQHQGLIADLFDLSGKVAMVTGGAMGIGQGIAFRLAEAGAAVVITDINLEMAQATVAQIQHAGGTATAIAADAAKVEDAKRAVEAAVSAFGRLDILVNNAGIFPFSPALEVTEKLWDRVMDINLKGLFFTTQAAAREMVNEGHGGKIINIASIDALHPSGMLVHYDSSKGGVVMMTKSLALEFGPQNILINAIAPGGIQTPGASSPTTSEEILKAFTARIPLRRMGVPDDIAKVALFLASDMSNYMTGSVIVVDGGYLQA
ncbi:SDR family NAD(P)-dependent oxidoreductase [Dictyobacter kobayashii]|uniref:2-deoxy-D-gluconate 3-dehydrogenase n=1 Tax=Dictyobacter kobayashii TaxID=2014872 RepID=A0A402AQS4_9CHLR|nr:SDR family oxidoreductase [Dictyobacter kobayashii]GCE21448.1 2-deoxy-D-gluconate 3-dehydrogenase [Dictyobacter kobayashii]